MLTSQDPGVGGYEGLHDEASTGRGSAGSLLTPRPWPMPRPPGPGLRAEPGSAGVATAGGAEGRAARRAGAPAQSAALVTATAPEPAAPSAALCNLIRGRGRRVRGGAGRSNRCSRSSVGVAERPARPGVGGL